jgi:hypothetical protein
VVDKELAIEYEQNELMRDKEVDPGQSERHTTSTQIKPKSRLDELKYSYCPDEKMPELSEEMLFRATNPKHIGIVSSGGLSNQIVDKIRDEYGDVFKNTSFETYYETFNRSIVPTGMDATEIDGANSEPEPKAEIDSMDVGDSSTEETDIKGNSDIDAEPDTNLKRETEAAIEKQLSPKHEYDDLAYEDDEFIFEPEPDSDFEPQTSEQVSDKTDQITSPNKEYTEVQKPMTLRERAHQIFIELKRKLGLLREHTPTPELEQKPKLETELKPEPEYVPEREPLPKTMEELEKDELLGEPVSEEGVSEEATPRAAYVQNAIKKVIGDKDILFIFTCLDDEHDIENALILSEITSKENILTIVIASLPRYFGNVENVYATNKILQRLRLIAEIVILIPYFETLDFKIIPKLVIELLEVISKPGLINLDVADLKIIVKGGNVGVITFGSGKHHTRHKDALFEAIDSRLVNVEFASVSKALINVKGGKDMTLGEVEGLAEQIRKRIKPGATLILGATIDQDLFDQISLFILIGITPMQIMVNMYANE